MGKLSLVLVLAGMMVAGPVRAEVVEIPLPELLGPYPGSSPERTTTFHLPGPVMLVYGAWFRIRGTQEVGTLVCENGPGPWLMDIEAWMTASPGRYWVALQMMPEQTGPFSWTAPFHTSPARPASWDFLLDGQAEIKLIGGPSGIPFLCVGTVEPSAVVDEAVLIVDAEFAVPVQIGTWGRIKGRYR